ncbi:hypothetical protein [Sphingomonas sp. UYEF23]|uniref:hypothetical protein n=1 Tax=Sphingomonas sp. UYEF23 TaxID=1756408 RepID=UPI0033953D9F
MKRRSLILATCAGALCIADGFWVYERLFRLNAAITYIGLDSVMMNVPASAQASQLRNGKWNIDLLKTLQSKFYDPPPGQKRWQVAFVSLGSQSQYGQAIAIIRDLKARQVCHVVVREGATVTPVKIDFGNGRETSLDVSPIILCGDAYGDGSGFFGPLPADHAIHVGAGSEASNGS